MQGKPKGEWKQFLNGKPKPFWNAKGFDIGDFWTGFLRLERRRP